MDYPGNSIDVDGVTYLLPATIDELKAIIEDAKTNDEVICLRGAAHSFPLIKTLEKGPKTGKKYKYIMLCKLHKVEINSTVTPPSPSNPNPSLPMPCGTVTVEAGCHLGPDPWDPTGISTLENSLLYKLDQAGMSLLDLGGISHQTVGGFLSTSSSGGSTQFAFDELLLSIDIMHYGANGVEITTFKMPADGNPDDPFFGAGVATMGLFGIIVSATFKCYPKFYIAGMQTTSTVANCEIDLFGDGSSGKPSFEEFLEQKQTYPYPSDITHYPYSRILWWPQPNVTSAVVWKARQTDEKGAMDWASTNGVLNTYQEVPWIMDSPTPMTLGGDLLYTTMGNWPNWLKDIMGNTEQYRAIQAVVDLTFPPFVYPLIMNKLFVAPGGQKFADDWYTGLPMDNQMSDTLFPVWFTELWIDIKQSQNVMNELNAFFSAGFENTGNFSIEIYAAKESNFWLCPAYKRDVIRIDVFWFGRNNGDPRGFYRKFWDLLAKYNYRPHWGKYLPAEDGDQGVNYLKANYPKWDDWMALREKMDPYQIFVNDYWRGHLGIPAPGK